MVFDINLMLWPCLPLFFFFRIICANCIMSYLQEEIQSTLLILMGICHYFTRKESFIKSQPMFYNKNLKKHQPFSVTSTTNYTVCFAQFCSIASVNI